MTRNYKKIKVNASFINENIIKRASQRTFNTQVTNMDNKELETLIGKWWDEIVPKTNFHRKEFIEFMKLHLKEYDKLKEEKGEIPLRNDFWGYFKC